MIVDETKPQEVKNKVLLITTDGCRACEIMIKLIQEAIAGYKHPVSLIVKDIKDVNKDFLKRKRINDFPTMFLSKDDIVMFKYEGTAPAVVILQWMKVYFNKR